VLSYYHINNSDYGIAIFHPVTSEDQTIQRQAQELFKGLEASGRFFVLILPNNDPGHEKVFQVICDLSDKSFRQIPSMRFEYFSVLLKNSKCVVGNSSTGVREAPFLGIPSLNVGTRQNARSSAASITNCSAFDRKSILLFLEKMWGVTFPSDPEFGDGTASENFKQILDSQSIWNLPEQKYFQD
jgi:UDP-N-acetylglucosamine 2-epimerase (hydrolysing)